MHPSEQRHMGQDVDALLDTVEEACRSATSLYGAGSVERGQDGIRFQSGDGAVEWAARARVVPRTTGDREAEEGWLRSSEIGENAVETGEYSVRVAVTAGYDVAGEHVVDRYTRNGVAPENVEAVLEQAYQHLPHDEP